MVLKDGWFYEESEDFPGQSFGLKVKKVLREVETPFQHILVFESESFGNVLVLDGIIQCTERDEFAYQEMITHLPLFSHPNPERVLVIGGGDGGVLREVVKHSSVKEVTLVEIDETVIQLSKQYLPGMACGFDNSKVKVVITDGFQYLKENVGSFDVIITDSSDPDGPAVEFFKSGYFELLRGSLKTGGIVISMASENIWLKVDKLRTLRNECLQVFGNVKCSLCMIPSYTSGQIALMVSTMDETLDLTKPNRAVDLKLRYYNGDIHSGSFLLPEWSKDVIYG